MSFNGQTKIPCINLITLNLNERFPLILCINLINHYLNKAPRTKADNPLFQDGAHKQNNKISRKIPAEATIALMNQGKVFFCVCIAST